jgi:hypothetical protein
MGKDHLLCVDVEGFTESYRRFFFRDLQMITIRTTKRRAVLNGIFGVLFALFMAEMVFDGPGPFSVIFGFLFGFLLLLNNLLGTTCRVFFQTAVQTEEIPSLSRVPRTQRVLARIRPLIAESQGLLSAEDAAAHVRELVRE